MTVACVTTTNKENGCMSNNNWDDDDDLDFDTQVQSEGNKAMNELRKAKRADEKRIKELTEQHESLTKAQRERTVKEILEQKGINTKATRLILKDLDAIDDESVNRWLDENGDLFGYQKEPAQSPEQQVDLAALRQQDVLTMGAVSPSRSEDIYSKLSSAKSADEIIQLINNSE